MLMMKILFVKYVIYTLGSFWHPVAALLYIIIRLTRYCLMYLQSIRLNTCFILQNRFDTLWRRYITYSGGEELFGLPVTEYPELMQIRRELNLLQKLYGLYNDVIDTVNGYYDILWTDVNIEKINQELLEFQTR